MADEQIKKTWDHWKLYFHSLQSSLNKEIHHIWGRVGVLKCCPLLMTMLTNKEHNDYILLKKLREITLELKKVIVNNYVPYLGCQDKVSQICLECPLYKENQK
jgi:hypothetical protein